MTPLKLHIDRVGYNSKPKEHISSIKPRTQSKTTVVDVNIEELLQSIKQGKTISPGIMDGGCKAENWKEQQLFLIDIDNDSLNYSILTVEEARKVCDGSNLTPAFMYYSFSHSDEKPKFRIGFVMDEVVTSNNKRKAIVETLIGLFVQADTSCKNADRIFYGTNKDVVFSNDSRISFDDILKIYKPPETKPTSIKGNIDYGLERLKKEFDLFGYLQQRNGETVSNNSTYTMFKHCELCKHKRDLVYYHKTNTFYCFSNGCGKGGSIIDYLMIADNLSTKEAILKFKHEILELPKTQLSKEQRRDYAINKRVKADADILNKLHEVKPELAYQHNDKGFGELFADLFVDTCRFNVTAKEWYVYDGKKWIEDTGGMIAHSKAKQLYDALLRYSTTIEDDVLKRNYIDISNKYGSLNKRETMIKDARDKYFITQETLDGSTKFFNCQNGTLNLDTFEFTEHNSNDLLSKISNVIYNRNAESQDWKKFINEVMQGDVEKINYIQKVLGYSLTADTSLETCFILYGATTRNGKSTLVETIAYLMGNSSGYALNMQPQTLAQKQNTDSRQASGDIARLKGCRFLNASEPPKRMMFDVALLKTLLGRDSITARHLHQREFEFIPCFKLFINTNYLPLITDDTLFTSGRINVITFDKHFPEKEQDKCLKNRLKQEKNLSGIFNWLLEGLKKFKSEGATLPEAIINANAEYRSNSDKVGNFITECLERTENNTKASNIYKRYSRWCEDNGFGVENKSNFFDELKAKNILARSGTVDGETYKNVVLNYEIIRDEIENSYTYHPFC